MDEDHKTVVSGTSTPSTAASYFPEDKDEDLDTIQLIFKDLTAFDLLKNVGKSYD